MEQFKLSRGGKKYLRREKARIRRIAVSEEEKDKLIKELKSRLQPAQK
ncbi:MAG: hypothetical protein PHD51_00260 [Patescibacteria group bacterium]|nr:hypothetical protein [Patescibacteria group bacterium]MDD5490698.1 hypothetical protein [Patescibacteria group bacterium]